MSGRSLAGLRRADEEGGGFCCILIWNSGCIDLLAGDLPHTLSAPARQSLSFLSTNILNSRVTRKGTRGRSLAAIQLSNTSARSHSHSGCQTGTTLEPRGFENTSKSEAALGQQGWPAMLLGALTVLRGQTARVMSSVAIKQCLGQDQADHPSKLGSQSQPKSGMQPPGGDQPRPL